MKVALKNTFKSDYDGAISILNRTKEISGYDTIMTLDLSSQQKIDVRKETYYTWPLRIIVTESLSGSVTLKDPTNCSISSGSSPWTIIPNKKGDQSDVDAFYLTISATNSLATAGSGTVTIGEP